jgi:hypothetical protein
LVGSGKEAFIWPEGPSAAARAAGLDPAKIFHLHPLLLLFFPQTRNPLSRNKMKLSLDEESGF